MITSASLVLCFAILELSARVFLGPVVQHGSVLEPHPDYLFTLKAGFTTELPVSMGDHVKSVSVTISPQGFRDREFGPKAPDEFRILMLGDSNTMGTAVEFGDSIPKVLERALARNTFGKRITVINAGIGGGGGPQELGILRDRGFALEPDLVIFQVFSGNDFANCLELDGRRLRSYSERWERVLDAFRKHQLPQFRVQILVSSYSVAYQHLLRLGGRRVSIAYWLSKFPGYTPWKPPNRPKSDGRHYLLEPDLIVWYPELEDAFSLLKQYVRDIRADCKEHGTDFLAYVQPDVISLHDEILAGTLWARGANPVSDYERGKGIRVLEEFFEQDGIGWVPLAKSLEEHGRPETLFIMSDGHMNELGNKIAAKVIFQYLSSTYFPEKFAVSSQAGAQKF